MRIKLILTASIAVFTLSNARGQVSYTPGNKYISIGHGFANLDGIHSISRMTAANGNTESFKSSKVGTLSFKFEQALNEKQGLGVSINYYKQRFSYKDTFGSGLASSVQLKSGSTLAYSILARYNRIFAIKEQSHFYFGIGLGYRVRQTREKFDVPGEAETVAKGLPLGFETTLGFRYFPLPAVGLYIETGLAKSLLQAGITIQLGKISVN